jgi:DNA-binding response OmpR family regulator
MRRMPRTAPAAGGVLLVLGKSDLRERLTGAFGRDGVTLSDASTGADGLRALFQSRPGVVIVGSGLPDLNIWTMLERVRQICDVPVLVLSDEFGELEVVRALRSGADQVLTGTVGMAELLARTDALLRRSQSAEAPRTFYSDGVVEIDLLNAEARVDGRPLGLTPLEFRLLCEFARHPNQSLSAEQLLELVWGENILGRDRVKIYVGYLRAKFRAQGAEAPIVTTRGFGYRYVPAA